MKALDYMIEKGLYEYHCDAWYGGEHSGNYASVKNIQGQINHRGMIFIVHHYGGFSGLGGMSEGDPDSVNITRVRLLS